MPGLSFEDFAREAAPRIEAALDRLLSPEPREGEAARPERLLGAMRHAMLGGGKRLRPVLTLATARVFGVGADDALQAGLAVECVHGYSLIHDDLPAMDDDDLRRGRPTVHRAFDEATAILAGDALQTIAFAALSDPAAHPDPAVRIELVGALARAAGLGGMAGGQMLDLDAEGRFGAGGPKRLAETEVALLQGMKTGALITASVEMGAILGGADAAARGALEAYARALGAAFQIADDLLDAEGSAGAVGKATGKDAAAGKGTLVSVLGVSGARARLSSLTEDALAALERFDARAEPLRGAALFVAAREA